MRSKTQNSNKTNKSVIWYTYTLYVWAVLFTDSLFPRVEHFTHALVAYKLPHTCLMCSCFQYVLTIPLSKDAIFHTKQTKLIKVSKHKLRVNEVKTFCHILVKNLTYRCWMMSCFIWNNANQTNITAACIYNVPTGDITTITITHYTSRRLLHCTVMPIYSNQ